MNGHAATVTKVANGYIVEISVPIQVYPVQNEFAQQAKLLKEAIKSIKKDEQLDNLGIQEKSEDKVDVKSNPESNIHIFSTFEEVSEFLEYHFEKQ